MALLREAFPSVRIGYVTKSRYADLVASHPAIDRVHLLKEGSAGAMSSLGRELRTSGYTAVVDLHDNFRSRSLAGASRASMRTVYRKRERRDAFRVRVLHRPFRASKLLVRRYIEALGPLGVSPSCRAPRLYVSESDDAAAGALLHELGLAEVPFATVVPGSVWPTKRWPADRFAELATEIGRKAGLRVVLLGNEGERSLCEDVARGSEGNAVVAAGLTSLGQTASVISKARVYVGNDSGPTHMAMALKTPTVAIFGPTDPGQFDFTGHELLYRDPACGACSFYGGRSCRLGHWDCMESIATSDVADAVIRLMEAGGVR